MMIKEEISCIESLLPENAKQVLTCLAEITEMNTMDLICGAIGLMGLLVKEQCMGRKIAIVDTEKDEMCLYKLEIVPPKETEETTIEETATEETEENTL